MKKYHHLMENSYLCKFVEYVIETNESYCKVF